MRAWPAWPRLGLGGSFAYRPGNLSLAWGGGRGADPWTNSWTKSDTAGYCIRSIDCYSRLWRSESLCHPQILLVFNGFYMFFACVPSLLFSCFYFFLGHLGCHTHFPKMDSTTSERVLRVLFGCDPNFAVMRDSHPML